MSEILTTAIDEGIATVTLNRPDARNAISTALRAELVTALESLNNMPAVSAIVLTGAGAAFSGGVDIKELASSPEIARSIGPRTSPIVTSLKPLIGAINGAAYTGGLELALACHWLIASERATFADTHARLGLTAGWGMTVLLAEAIGTRRARQMSATCEPIDAATALSWGLVNEVVEHEALIPRTMDLARAAAHCDDTAVTRAMGTYTRQRQVIDGGLWEIEASDFIDPATRVQNPAGRP